MKIRSEGDRVVKCNLNGVELEEVYLRFGKINQARAEIKAGISAHEDYAETINEINGLSADDSEYGEELCRRALEQLRLIRLAELAQLSVENLRAELAVKYEVPASRSGGEALYG